MLTPLIDRIENVHLLTMSILLCLRCCRNALFDHRIIKKQRSKRATLAVSSSGLLARINVIQVHFDLHFAKQKTESSPTRNEINGLKVVNKCLQEDCVMLKMFSFNTLIDRPFFLRKW